MFCDAPSNVTALSATYLNWCPKSHHELIIAFFDEFWFIAVKLFHHASSIKGREFFEVSPERVVSALKLAELENVTPGKDYVETAEDQQALNQARTRRAVFNFKMANIPVGAELSYTNDESIKAKVIDNRLIEFEGEITSPSAAAQKLLGYSYQVQGTVYWTYEGETLDERRRRLEAEE